MATKRGSDRRVWVVAGGGAVIAVLLVLTLFRVPAPEAVPVSPEPKLGFYQFGNGSELLQQEADMHDPTPLFLPTSRNTRPGIDPEDVVREPGGAVAEDFPSRLFFSEGSVQIDFPDRVSIPASPAEALALAHGGIPFLGMGRTDSGLTAPPPRDAYVEVKTLTGVRSLALAIRGASPPEASDWRPVEYLVVVDSAGLVAPPLISRSSNVAALDRYYRDYLANDLHLGQRLSPGSYLVTVGP